MVYQRKHEYEYREGWRPSVDANTVGGVMEGIERRNGVVTSELFLEASRAEDSPTHGVFEWDDGIAAERYRLNQAQNTICAVRVVIRDEQDGAVSRGPQRAFVNIVPDDKKRGEYMNVIDAMANEATRHIVLMRAVRELKSFQEKYADLAELADVFKAIASVKV